jgi:hypothetical protein
MIPEKQKISWLTAILRGLLFAFIWLILSEGAYHPGGSVYQRYCLQ